jgi:hypothetical protein
MPLVCAVAATKRGWYAPHAQAGIEQFTARSFPPVVALAAGSK